MQVYIFGLIFTVLSFSLLNVVISQPLPPFSLSLSDPKIISSRPPISLNGVWSLSSSTVPLKLMATVPGDIVTDLQSSGIIVNPLLDLNYQNSSIFNDNIWTYEKNFKLDSMMIDRLINVPGFDILMIFDGVKMGSILRVNGMIIDTIIDQFQRYNYSLKSLVNSTDLSNATVSLSFDLKIDCHGLWMACTGGWDWAFMTNTSNHGMSTFSYGIVKDVYLIVIDEISITHLTPHVYYTGVFPTEALQPHAHAPFLLNVTVHMYTPASINTPTLVSLYGDWRASGIPVAQSTLQLIPKGDSSHSLIVNVSASDIDLWWPIGMGEQTLYHVRVEINRTSTGLAVADSRHFGFRYFAIVTGNDTDPQWVLDNTGMDGSGNFSLRWRMNGALIFPRGASVVPMEEMEGRWSGEAHARMVYSARDGGMQMLRIWGGGMFLPTVFYEACDRAGLIVYHDMPVRFLGMTGLTVQMDHVRHNIRRLSHHPSIVIWDGCNECQPGPTDPIVTVELATIANEDFSRAIWPASPAHGWASGVNRLDSHPNGNLLASWTKGGITELHGPYQHGTGFQAVNGNTQVQLFDPMIPLMFEQVPTGISVNGTFTSEFGCSVMSSFESMTGTISPPFWSIHGGTPPDNCTDGFFGNTCWGDNVFGERNYPCDNIIIVYFGGHQPDFDAVGEIPFKMQLYYCIVGQALNLKGQISLQRATNTFGLIIWQLNEIWPTGGWGSLEYGTVSDLQGGQVIGGRFKPLHHWLNQYLFRDIMTSCGLNKNSPSNSSLLCYIRNDNTSGNSVPGSYSVYAIDVRDSSVTSLLETAVDLPGGPFSLTWFPVTVPSNVHPTTHIFRSLFTMTNIDSYSENYDLLTEPKNLQLQSNALSLTISDSINPDGSVDIKITTSNSAVALYATITTLAQGRFSQNCLVIASPTTYVTFLPFGKLNLSVLKQSIRIEHVADYKPLLANYKFDQSE